MRQSLSKGKKEVETEKEILWAETSQLLGVGTKLKPRKDFTGLVQF